VGHIDDSIFSRIQVAITYSKLSVSSQRTIWQNFLKKLESDRSNIRILNEVHRYIENDTVIDIALQIAISLAEDDSTRRGQAEVQLTVDIIKEVVERRQSFVSYINNINDSTEDQRAFNAGDRPRLVQ